ncbi:threonine/serine exporter family protein [Lactobacillus delbrueckii]|uniref:threonine/serine exporter family protein n=1 Tax=Lactobacillus delbrueckii TaxID=1584 RepID=UPI003A8A8638
MKRVVHTCLKAGRLMLAGGSEMYRVEDTMRRIAVNAGIKEVNVFAMPTGLFVSLDDGECSTVTELETVKKRAINLELVDQVNEFSREFADKRIDLEELEEKLREIEENIPTFPLWLQVIGASGYLMDSWLTGHTKIRFLAEMIAAMEMGLLTIIINGIFPACNVNNILTGALMTLVPGLALTNASRDLFMGDWVSGIVRMCEAAMTAIALGGGVGIVIRFLGA